MGRAGFTGLLGGQVGGDDGAEDDQKRDAEAHDGDLGFSVGPAGKLPEGRDGLEVLALGRERALEAGQVAGEVDVGLGWKRFHGGDEVDRVDRIDGGDLSDR